VHRFVEELRALRAHVFLARTIEDGRASIREVVLQREVRSVALSASPAVVSLGVESVLAEVGVEIIPLPADSATSSRLEYKRRLMTADLGITGADFGLAESGTLVVRTGQSEGRLVSLVPPVHMAILTADRLLPDVAALIPHLPHPPSSSGVIFITGPSRTADIELTLTVGVHGPRELHVLLLE
jgi:L-lactate dehydrogenase complex protein LldG